MRRKRSDSCSRLLIAATAALVQFAGIACDNRPRSSALDDAPELETDGASHALTAEISALGLRQAGERLEITVDSSAVRAAYLLAPDDLQAGAGVVIDGGKPNAAFIHRVRRSERLYLFVDVPLTRSDGVLQIGGGDVEASVRVVSTGAARPAVQDVVVQFEAAFLSEGLFDPAADTPDDQAFLAAIEPTVMQSVIDRLREIFAGTAITISEAAGAVPADSSTLIFSPLRVVVPAGSEDALPVVGCGETVLFGEVLPRGDNVDPGNRNPGDAAVVYVGSFRGRGACNVGLVVNSVNNIVNALALSAAHEIGHLIGLNHTALDGLMSPSPSLSVSRQIGFERSQLVLDVGRGPEVLPFVVQDPQRYFETIFAD